MGSPFPEGKYVRGIAREKDAEASSRKWFQHTLLDAQCMGVPRYMEEKPRRRDSPQPVCGSVGKGGEGEETPRL